MLFQTLIQAANGKTYVVVRDTALKPDEIRVGSFEALEAFAAAVGASTAPPAPPAPPPVPPEIHRLPPPPPVLEKRKRYLSGDQSVLVYTLLDKVERGEATMDAEERAFLRLLFPKDHDRRDSKPPAVVAEEIKWSADKVRETRNMILRKYHLIDF